MFVGGVSEARAYYPWQLELIHAMLSQSEAESGKLLLKLLCPFS